MAWTTAVNVSDVRTEYPLWTLDLVVLYDDRTKFMEFGFAQFPL